MNGSPAHPREQYVQAPAELDVTQPLGAGKRTNYRAAAGGKLRQALGQQMLEASSYPVANHRTSDPTPHDKSDPSRDGRAWLFIVARREYGHDQRLVAGAPAGAKSLNEVRRGAQSGLRR